MASSITKENVILLESERILDQSDELGGGKITGKQIYTGQENSMFEDISGISRVNGRVDLAKCFVAINTDNTDKYLGAHAIISEIPEDDTVSITMFTTKDWNDVRADAKDYVERYLSKSTKMNCHLMGKQLTGQKAITIWQREFVSLPDIGSVMCLIQDEDKPGQYEQYVRITKVSSLLTEFVYSTGTTTVNYKVNVLTVTLADSLMYDFDGVEPSPYDSGLNEKAIIRDTLPVDAANYFGTVPLQEAASSSDMYVMASSLYTQLVPSSQSAIPAVGLDAGGQAIALIKTGTSPITIDVAQIFSPTVGIYLGTAAMPGTITITVNGDTLTDSGGFVKKADSTTVANVDYNAGIITALNTCPTYSVSRIGFTPAAPFQRVMDTAYIYIQPENRTGVYVINLFPPPTPGSVMIDYRAQNKWYRLYDDGSGAIKGLDSSYGVAGVNFATGNVTLTTGALPDNGSDIIFYWASTTSTFDRTDLPVQGTTISFTLEHFPVLPHSYTATYILSGTTYTLTDNGSGLLTSSNGGTGTIDYITGEVVIVPQKTVPVGQQVLNDYQWDLTETMTVTGVLRNLDGKVDITIAPNIVPGSVEISWDTIVDTSAPELQTDVSIWNTTALGSA
jgi:hypothetical protein